MYKTKVDLHHYEYLVDTIYYLPLQLLIWHLVYYHLFKMFVSCVWHYNNLTGEYSFYAFLCTHKLAMKEARLFFLNKYIVKLFTVDIKNIFQFSLKLDLNICKEFKIDYVVTLDIFKLVRGKGWFQTIVFHSINL